jgi:hypothetical protein
VAPHDALAKCARFECILECGLPAPICESGFLFDNPTEADVACSKCLGSPGCCEDFTACNDDMNCSTCVGQALDSMSDPCMATMLDEAVGTCFEVTCVAECGG